MQLGSAAAVRRDVACLIKPPPATTPVEAGEQYVIDPKTGQSFDSSVAPYMREPLNLMASREFDQLVFVGPSRSSKTFSLISASIAYILKCNPGPTGVLQMNQSEAGDWSKTDLEPMLQQSPHLAALMGSAASDNNINLKLFRNGMSLRMLWPSMAKLSGKTIRWMLIVDGDNSTGDLAIDQAFPLAAKRTQTFHSAGMCAVEGNPSRDLAEPTWQPGTPHEAPSVGGMLGLYNGGDRRMRYWPCPDCGEYFCASPGFSLFRLPDMRELVEILRATDPTELSERFARIPCPHNCGAAIQQEHRSEMESRGLWLADGETVNRWGVISGQRPRSRRASFWLGGVSAFANTWQAMLWRYFSAVREYARAQNGNCGPIKQVLNTEAAWPHTPLSILLRRRETNGLARRAEEWSKGTVPVGVRFLVASADVQGNRFVCQVVGFGPGAHAPLDWWLVDRFEITASARLDERGQPLPLNPQSYPEDWFLLKQLAVRPYLLPTGAHMRPLMVVADSGGKAGATPNAYAWWRQMQLEGFGRRCLLVKGYGGERKKLAEETYPDTSGRSDRGASVGDVPVLALATDRLKDAISADLERCADGKGGAHFPAWLQEECPQVYDELAVEQRTARGWVCPSGARNEALDLIVYPRGVCALLGADQPAFWLRPPEWAAEWSRNSLVSGSAAAPRVAPVRRNIPTTGSSY